MDDATEQLRLTDEQRDLLNIAFEAIFEQLQERVHRGTRLYGNLQARCGASDLLMSATRELLATIAGQSDNRLLLLTIANPDMVLRRRARYKLIEVLEKQRTAKRDISKQQPLDSDAASLEPDPALRAEIDELIEHLYTAISNLPDRQKEVLMRLLEGGTYEDIASDLDIAIPTARGAAHAARHKLRESMTTLLEKGTE